MLEQENTILFNVSTLCVCAGFDCSIRTSRIGVLKPPCSINKNKVKMKFMKNLTHNWLKVLHHWKMKKEMT